MPKVIADQEVFSAVIQTIVERCYHGATTKELARAAGISEGSLFRKYGSKVGLVRRAIAELIERTDFSTAARFTGDLQADLGRVVAAYQASAVEHGFFFFTLFMEIRRHPELREAVPEPLSLFRDLVELLARYQQEGVLRQESSFRAVAALLGPLMYAGMMSRVLPETSDHEPDLEEHVDRFLHGRKSE